ncbi:MAG TPA: Crp/Fnr family transcriptional regulator [Thermoanaerobaculia bacterium]|nr:Crp/Fnr family transcriptional regulator [Thermoanaerobaculia bacterium]
MAGPYGFEAFDNCLTCSYRGDRFFCNLEGDALKAFDTITFTSVYPSGSILFAEGQTPRGVFMICRGKAKMTTTSSGGKTLITRVAEEGEVLGLGSVLADKPHKATAETVEPTQVNFIKRDDFQRFLKDYGEACFHAAQQLADECESADDHVRSLGLSHSAAEKLAHLLLTWCTEEGKEIDGGWRLKLTMTHQEISQMIGTSRETVTRLFGEFKEKKILSIKGSTLMIHRREALERMVLL